MFVANLHFSYPVNIPALVIVEGHIVLSSAGVHALGAVCRALVEVDHHSPPVFGKATLLLGCRRTTTGQKEQAPGTGRSRQQQATSS